MEHGFSTIKPNEAARPVDSSLRVTKWMSKNVFATTPSTLLVDAIEIMRDHRIRHVPVLDGEKLVGIVSDRDVRNSLPRKVDFRGSAAPSCESGLSRRVSDVMTKYPITIAAEDSIHEAAEIMCREKVGALPVLDRGRMIGIISAEDLLWALMQITGEARSQATEDPHADSCPLTPAHDG